LTFSHGENVIVLLGCDTTWTCRQIPTYQRNIVSIFRADVRGVGKRTLYRVRRSSPEDEESMFH
jgi:hypothetical protein